MIAQLSRPLTLGFCVVLACLGVWSASQAAPPAQDLFPDSADLLTWTPDSQRLVVVSRNGIGLYDLQQLDAPQAQFGQTISYSVSEVVITADGAHIATRHDPVILGALNVDDDLRAGLGWVWDVERGERAFALTGHDLLRSIDALTFSPDGRLVLYGGLADGLIHVREAATGAEVMVLNPVADDAAWEPGLVIPALIWLGFSPNGDLLASSHVSGDIVLWDTTTWERLAVLHGLKAQRKVAFSASGETILARDGLGLPAYWRTRDGADLLHTEIAFHMVDTVCFDADGRGLGVLVESPQIKLFDLEAGSARTVQFEGLTFPEIFPDLRVTSQPARLIYGVFDGEQDALTFRLLDLATGTIPFTVTIPGAVTALSLSPDGALLAIGRPGTVELWDVSAGEQVDAILLPVAPPPDFG